MTESTYQDGCATTIALVMVVVLVCGVIDACRPPRQRPAEQGLGDAIRDGAARTTQKAGEHLTKGAIKAVKDAVIGADDDD